MKVNRHGQGELISDADYTKIRKALKNKKHRLLIDVARFTGERWGAIVQIRVSDVFDRLLNVRSHITFRAQTRKATPSGDPTTRQVVVHPDLRESLKSYSFRADQVWLFEGATTNTPLTLKAADLMLRSVLAKTRLADKGICTHSTRRTFIPRLYERGVDLHTIQIMTGHKDIRSLVQYIQADFERAMRAIALL